MSSTDMADLCEKTDASSEVTLLSALHSKYSDDDAGDLGFQICHVCVPKSAPGRKASGALVLPKCLSLNDYHITTIGDVDEVAEFCCGVCELDLTKNDIKDLHAVIMVVEKLPHLTFLNLCSNPLNIGLDQDVNYMPNTRLKTLVLNNTGVTMETVQQLMDIFPELQELHMSLNNYKEITLDKEKPHKNLKSLHFNNNSITDWPELCKFGHAFPCLETLFITETKLEKFEEVEQTVEAFPNLKSLWISKTSINSWDEIDKLNNWFPALIDVRLTGIPVLDNFTEKERLHFLLARLPRIQMLNGSRVQEETRFDGERAFIRYYMDKEEKPTRFYDLQQKHGKLDQLVDVDLAPLPDPLVKVTFGNKVKTMRINPKLTVGELKETWVDFCGIAAQQMRVFLMKPYANYVVVELKNPKKFLYSLLVEDGDSFVIEKNPYKNPAGSRYKYRPPNIRKTTN